MLLYFCFNCGENTKLRQHKTICAYQNTPQPDDLIKEITYVNIATEYIKALLHKATTSLTELIYELRNKSTTEPHWFPQAIPSSYCIDKLAKAFQVEHNLLKWFLRPRNIFRLHELFSIDYLDYWTFSITFKFSIFRPLSQSPSKKFLIFGNSKAKRFNYFNTLLPKPLFQHIHFQKSANLLQLKQTVEQYNFIPGNFYIIYIIDAVCSITIKSKTGVYFNTLSAKKVYNIIQNFNQNLQNNIKVIHVPIYHANIIKYNSRRFTFRNKFSSSKLISDQNKKLQKFLLDFNNYIRQINPGPTPDFTFCNTYSDDGIHLNSKADHMLFKELIENMKIQI